MKILFFLDYIQDVDLLLPLARKASEKSGWQVSVCFTDRLYGRFPCAASDFKSLPVQFRVVARWKILLGLGLDLEGLDVLVTASESNLRPHWAAHRLTQQANRRGIKTYTLQHGFEQAGLTYFDRRNPPGTVCYASQRIFIWGEEATLHPDTPADVKARCVSVGCPKELRGPGAMQKPEGRPFVVAVFENLHWHRYTNEYRAQFAADLKETAGRFPEILFSVRPHPDHRWIERNHAGLFSDVTSLVLNGDGIRDANAVITTLSTVALDGAMAGLPVAVVAYDLNVSPYRPLFAVRSQDDWCGFIRSVTGASGHGEWANASRQFVNRTVIQGDAVEAILRVLRSDCSFMHPSV